MPNQEDTILDRKLPFSLSAEQALLGSILIDPNALNEVADLIRDTDFYITEHTKIYLALRELFLTNNEIDVVTLVDMLVRQGVYEKSGGQEYIRTLAEAVPSAMNVKDYARIVKDKSTLRQLIGACSEISDSAYSEQDAVSSIIDSAENRIFSIAQGRDTKNFRHIREVLGSVYAHLHEISAEGGEAAQGTKTGFSGLDNVLAGMGNSDLILVGARPGMGKTSFTLNIASNVAIQTKKKVAIFSLEMSADQLVSRMLSSEAMVDSYALRSGKLSPEDWVKLGEASSKLYECDILIDDTAGITVTGMKAKLRRVENLGLVCIDYLQLMHTDRHIDNRVQEVGEISRAMKIMAKELNVPILCCAQLSRGPESRTDKKPMLSDLRDSGSIEQDADVVLFLYRGEYYNADDNPEMSVAEVIIAKNRHGSTGTVKMGWSGRFTKFCTLADEDSLPQ
ncbi:MAG: replicative DNA helicase [Clostridia bacterium]|nr:replicative DNA helicase [Clostridia bacterium]